MHIIGILLLPLMILGGAFRIFQERFRHQLQQEKRPYDELKGKPADEIELVADHAAHQALGLSKSGAFWIGLVLLTLGIFIPPLFLLWLGYVALMIYFMCQKLGPWKESQEGDNFKARQARLQKHKDQIVEKMKEVSQKRDEKKEYWDMK